MSESAGRAQSEPDDIGAFATNMARLFDTSQEIWRLYMSTHRADETPLPADPLNMVPAFGNLASALFKHPEALAEASARYWAGQMAVWQAAASKVMGASDPDADLPNLPEGGKRFSHPQWSENALFEYMKRSYLLASDWTHSLVDSAQPELDVGDRKKVAFATRNFVEALNPANFFALNPEVIETTLKENGANLVRGAEMLLADMRRGKGDLLIRQTDMDAFEVGRNMAVTPGKVVYRNRIMELIQYAPTTDKVHETPLLFIPPWINKYYVLDLNEKKSMMKWLVDQGHTVFIISWVNPDQRHRGETWESYMEKGALTAIDKVLEETGAKAVNIASYCIGGTMAGSMMAKLSRSGDRRVKSATFFTAQLDFVDAGELQVFVENQTVKLVDACRDKGVFPAENMAQAFNSLRSNDLIWSYVVSNYMLGKDPFPFDLLYWNSDSTAMPVQVHHYYLEEFYINNRFAAGSLPVGGERYGIGDIAGPVYHIATVEDHIAPASSVYRGARAMTKSDVTFVLSGSGHIAGVVNPPAAGKYQYWVNTDLSPETLEEWRERAEMHQGSWWPHWDGWLAGHSGRKVAARVPGRRLKVLGPAPGTYVKVRFDRDH